LLIPQPANAQDAPALDLSGDVRLRAEQDWDSQTATGTPRLERTRARVRARVQADADLGGFRLQGRVRTGTPGSQQNANITFADFDGNPSDDFDVVADRYALRWRSGAVELEGGRMAFPFFTPNEYFWDGDISPLGGAASATLPLSGSTKFKLTGGAFALPVGLSHYSGRLAAGQAVVQGKDALVAVGLFRFDADPNDPNNVLLLDGNGSRDYTVLDVNAQYKLPVGGKAFQLNADFYRNLESYGSSPDPISVAGRNQRTGYVLSSAWGDTAAPGHFQIGYRYFRMEKFAVNASYSHDDVARLGTATQAALTDLKGHDLFVSYVIAQGLTLSARAMAVERITNREDGKRARLDLAYSF
jgi:hypothetical protein